MTAGRRAAPRAVVEGALPFLLPVPWRLHLPPGRGGPAPLLVALHGKGDRADRFEAEALDALPRGWALLVPSAPLPRDRAGGGDRAVGGSWYLYDGDTALFRESLARAEAHVVGLLARILPEAPPPGFRAPDPARISLLGFSQGGYLAGVAAVRRPGLFRAAVVAGGRLKHEMLADAFPAARAAGLALLGLHGAEDGAVHPAPAEGPPPPRPARGGGGGGVGPERVGAVKRGGRAPRGTRPPGFRSRRSSW